METLPVVALVLQLSGVAPPPPGLQPRRAPRDRSADGTTGCVANAAAVPSWTLTPQAPFLDRQAPRARAGFATIEPQDKPQPRPEPSPERRHGPDPRFDPILAAWSSEPAMAYGGLALASVQRVVSRLLESGDALRQHPGVAAAWEFPFALALSTVTHEVNGHGGRAREFGLHAEYGFDPLNLSAFTSTREVPPSRDDVMVISEAGTEADSVLANRLFLDLLRPGGAEASTLPLAVIAKLDLTLYVLKTPRPDAAHAIDFRDQSQQGNDIANYLVDRQGQRRGLDVNDIWNQVANIDYDDALLQKNYEAARWAAIWNLLDPVMVASSLEYVREHLGHGAARIGAPMLPLSHGLNLLAGTRAFLAPSYVTRYLDVYTRVPVGVASAYVRDLDSSIERTWGWGAGFTLAPQGSRLSAAVTGDRWDEPASIEHGAGRSGWNVSGEVRVPLASRVGVLANVGHKTLGFVPGRPINEGTYAGLGVLISPW